MGYTGLSDLKIFFLIPRRRGHNEVISSVQIGTTTDTVESEDFIKYFLPFQKKVLTKDILFEIGEKIINQFRLSDLNISINFNLPIDKLNVNLEDSICFILNCTYSFAFNNNISNTRLSIMCPVRVNYLSTIEGSLSIEVINPSSNLYFEDILDLVIKYGKVIIYPLTQYSEKGLLEIEIDKGKTVKDYLNIFRIILIKRKMAEQGSVAIEFYDIYKSYKIKKGIEW
jgi:hypothetical protein